MRRRDFIKGIVGSATAWPLVARAQQSDGMRRIGVLMPESENDADYEAYMAAFRQGLQQLGWMEGRNVQINYRWGAHDIEVTQRFAKELVAQQPDCILTSGTPATASILQQTRTIPIVFAQLPDPVGSGFVALCASRRQRHRLHQ